MTTYKSVLDKKQVQVAHAAISWKQLELSKAFGDYGINTADEVELTCVAHVALTNSFDLTEDQWNFISEIVRGFAYHLQETIETMSQVLSYDLAKINRDIIQAVIEEAQCLINTISDDILDGYL